MTRYEVPTKNLVKNLRQHGWTIRELARKFGISPDTISRWVKDIELDTNAKSILINKSLQAQAKGRLTIEQRRMQVKSKIDNSAKELVSTLPFDTSLAKLCCALLFWCEGNKDNSCLRFTNSDPTLVKLFLSLLRKSFEIDESKLRILMHLHEYHDEEIQKRFWSQVSGIPVDQFSKSYLKPHTGTNKHIHYQGCVAIYYYDANIAKALASIYNAFSIRGVSQRQAGALQKLK